MNETLCQHIRFTYERASLVARDAVLSQTNVEELCRLHGRHLPFGLLTEWYLNLNAWELQYFDNQGWEVFLELAWSIHLGKPNQDLAFSLERQYSNVKANTWYLRAQEYALHIIPHVLAFGPEMQHYLPRI